MYIYICIYIRYTPVGVLQFSLFTPITGRAAGCVWCGTWPLHDIAITNIVVYVINNESRWGGVYRVMVVQWCCTRVGFAGGGDNIRIIDPHRKALK